MESSNLSTTLNICHFCHNQISFSPSTLKDYRPASLLCGHIFHFICINKKYFDENLNEMKYVDRCPIENCGREITDNDKILPLKLNSTILSQTNKQSNQNNNLINIQHTQRNSQQILQQQNCIPQNLNLQNNIPQNINILSLQQQQQQLYKLADSLNNQQITPNINPSSHQFQNTTNNLLIPTIPNLNIGQNLFNISSPNYPNPSSSLKDSGISLENHKI